VFRAGPKPAPFAAIWGVKKALFSKKMVNRTRFGDKFGNLLKPNFLLCKKNAKFPESCHIYNIYPPISQFCQTPLLFEKMTDFCDFFVTSFFGFFGKRKVTFSKSSKKPGNLHL